MKIGDKVILKFGEECRWTQGDGLKPGKVYTVSKIQGSCLRVKEGKVGYNILQTRFVKKNDEVIFE